MNQTSTIAREIATVDSSLARRLAILGSLLCVILLLFWTIFALHKTLRVDDAYMFLRYAYNAGHHNGLSWNANGPHTYGLTSLPWVGIVAVFSALPVSGSSILILASSFTFLLFLLLAVWSTPRLSKSSLFRNPYIVFCLVSAPLLINEAFMNLVANGLDTMLSMLVNLGLAVAVVSYIDVPSNKKAYWLGAISAASFAVRPDNGLCAVLIPLLACVSSKPKPRWTDAARVLIVFIGYAALQLAAAWAYFGTPLPLSFFMKSVRGYRGYINPDDPVSYLVYFIGVAAVYGVIGLFTIRRQSLQMVLVFGAPLLLTIMYFLTVRQILGANGRYYMPFLPFVIVPAFKIADSALADRWLPEPSRQVWMVCVMMVLLMIVGTDYTGMYLINFDKRFQANAKPSPQPKLMTQAGFRLPETDWFQNIKAISDNLLRPLPGDVSIAASEVGYLGYAGQHHRVIDLVGLNNTNIALHGFSMTELLSEKPDLIWFPDTNYTYQRAQMLEDPTLLEQYDLYAGAFNYGLAVRKDSKYYEQIMSALDQAWLRQYPNTAMRAFKVEAVIAN
ncbi:MAG TPA: hypothetical protein VK670_14270 [Silvibacterium sp.]|nr:hypothetical protein [Silvibacterium sp.]